MEYINNDTLVATSAGYVTAELLIESKEYQFMMSYCKHKKDIIKSLS